MGGSAVITKAYIIYHFVNMYVEKRSEGLKKRQE